MFIRERLDRDMSQSLSKKCVRIANEEIRVNSRVVKAQYAVRGLIPSRAKEIETEIESGSKKYPFSELVWCNIGNPQSLGQKPITFNRQVMALFDAPFLLEMPEVVAQFPPDVVGRAREYLAAAKNVTGAYTDSFGYTFARKTVATYINERDHQLEPKATFQDVAMTDGASAGLRYVFEVMLSGPEDAAMTPIPQYPLYTGLLALLDSQNAPYYLREKDNWSTCAEDFTKVYRKSVSEGATPRVFVCINPNNPTGSVLQREVMERIVEFCHEQQLLLLADEVYQLNIHAKDMKFVSFREVILTMPEPYKSETMLISLNSASKGILGECGRRGGYFDMLNIPKKILEQLTKLCSMNLCSNVNGQLMTALMCAPPQKGDPSYELYAAEYKAIEESLRERAALLSKELNGIPGISCQRVSGSMYAFPRITMPDKWAEFNEAQNAKEGRNLAMDARWALELLENTGIVVVPGSGFEQEPGTFHIRTTILPPINKMEEVVQGIRKFHEGLYVRFK